jgi:gliding motility-associated-like protein
VYLTVTTPKGCKGIDSAAITIHANNFAELDTVIALCPHEKAQFWPRSTDPTVKYVWRPSMYLDDSTASQPWVKPITTQKYWAVAINQFGCLDTVTVSVVVHPGATLFLTDSVTIYPGESYQISPQTNCVNFLWTPSGGLSNNRISNPVAKPETNTKYVVKGANEWGCVVSDTINVLVSTESLIALPNAFTPGGQNQTFKILKRGEATLNYFRIFNRWGNLLFETTDIDAGWDGTYKGQLQPFGVYVYDIEAVTSTGKKFHKTGNVTLIK